VCTSARVNEIKGDTMQGFTVTPIAHACSRHAQLMAARCDRHARRRCVRTLHRAAHNRVDGEVGCNATEVLGSDGDRAITVHVWETTQAQVSDVDCCAMKQNIVKVQPVPTR
jgi:hypothetical protein